MRLHRLWPIKKDRTLEGKREGEERQRDIIEYRNMEEMRGKTFWQWQTNERKDTTKEERQRDNKEYRNKDEMRIKTFWQLQTNEKKEIKKKDKKVGLTTSSSPSSSVFKTGCFKFRLK